MLKSEYLIVPKGTKFMRSGKLGVISPVVVEFWNQNEDLLSLVRFGRSGLPKSYQPPPQEKKQPLCCSKQVSQLYVLVRIKRRKED